ncbi:MAG: membrane protein of unknown function [Promethearchaeota archaeon]|nr:MAG: membrane protein of unknown function [Candidatus Lokiarchaeota archaeon]
MILEIIYHALGFLIIVGMVIVAIKFFVNYKYTGQKELLAGIIFAIGFLAGLVYLSFLFLFQVFGLDISVDDRTFLFINFGFVFLVMLSWFYIFYQFLYPNSNTVKILFYILVGINIVWELFFFYIIFFSTISFKIARIIVFIYNMCALSITGALVLILAIKSLMSKDKILKYRGLFLLIGFLLGGGSLVIDDGIFNLELAILDIIARVALIIGIFLIFFGFFMTEESRLYKFLFERKKEE